MNQQPLVIPAPPEVSPERIYVLRRGHLSILLALMQGSYLSIHVARGQALLVVRGVLVAMAVLTWVLIRRDRRKFETERGISESVFRLDPPPSMVVPPAPPRPGARKIPWILAAAVVVWLGGDLLLW